MVSRCCTMNREYVLLGLEFYFAAVLATSGLAKIDSPWQFAASLRRHRILPRRSIPYFAKGFPWLELLIGVFLIASVAPLFTAIATQVLFLAFLGIKSILFSTNRSAQCGCSGELSNHHVDAADIAVTVVQVFLAAVQLMLVIEVGPVSMGLRVPAVVLMLGLVGSLAYRVLRRHQQRQDSSAMATNTR